MKRVIVIGAGLAGSEAACAKRPVYDVRTLTGHKTAPLADAFEILHRHVRPFFHLHRLLHMIQYTTKSRCGESKNASPNGGEALSYSSTNIILG